MPPPRPRRNSAGAFAAPQPDAPVRWINHFIHTRQLLGPQHRQVVTPNNDTLYSNAPSPTWSQGPLLQLDVPDSAGRYYVLGLLDFYTNPFGYIGTRTTGNGRGRFLLQGPRWHGDVPAGATAIACPTDAVWPLGRVLVDGEADPPAVHALQDQFRLSNARRRRPPRGPFDVGMQPGEHLGDPRRYAEVVNQALRENPAAGGRSRAGGRLSRSPASATDCGGSAPG
ncbi:DUF1254 domain-containing protein [Cupriavidus basilensis]